jgi:TonB family protein
MKRLIASSLAAALVLAFGLAPHPARAQQPAAPAPAAKQKSREEVNKVRAEMDAGSRLYREGNFAQAVEHFRKALELDPEHKTAPLFVARALQEQYRPGNASPDNMAKGEAAVEAYRQLLSKNPLNEDAFNSIVTLYRQMNNPDKAREAMAERAADGSLPPAKRSALYAQLMRDDWQCSYNVTENKENKETSQQGEKMVIAYKMPADSNEFYKARQCVQRGLEAAEQALLLSPQSPQPLQFKANLFRESAKLAEMEGDASQKEAAENQYKEAMAEHQRLTGGPVNAVAGVPQGGAPTPADPNATPDPKAPVRGGVLNGKAVSKPQPAYPQEAMDARAQGTVTVQIVIDEDGNVTSAEAVSGHPLLREAAVNAAKQARFSPTLLSGQPVKVTGLVTYNFVLQ